MDRASVVRISFLEAVASLDSAQLTEKPDDRHSLSSKLAAVEKHTNLVAVLPSPSDTTSPLGTSSNSR